MSSLSENGGGRWTRRFIEEIQRSSHSVVEGSAETSPLTSEVREFEALVAVLGKAAELLARERGLDPGIARDLMEAGKTSSSKSVTRALAELESRLEAIREAPETPTGFLGASYEALYGNSSVASEVSSRQSSLHRRDHGVFFTPNALAELITARAIPESLVVSQKFDISILDPSCGPGTFLSAALTQMSRNLSGQAVTPSKLRGIKRRTTERCLFGVDRDPAAVAIARTVLWLEVGDGTLDPEILREQVVCEDSLTTPMNTWKDLLPRSRRLLDEDGTPRFEIILANPPWGGVKPMRREFIAQAENMRARGSTPWAPSDRSGREWTGTLDELWDDYAKWTRQYARALLELPEYGCLRARDSGDADLYQFFMIRMFSLLGETGRMGVVIPAGFQRALGASALRRQYLEQGHFEQISEIINRTRVFPIHGMFRFLLATYQRGSRRGVEQLRLGFSSVEEVANPEVARNGGAIPLSMSFIKTVGGRDWMIPDVRSRDELRLLRKIYRQHPTLGREVKHAWSVRFRREIDMTNDSRYFTNVVDARSMGWKACEDGTWMADGTRYLPVYEGRMINQFDSAAKGYRHGSGRSAFWEVLEGSGLAIQSQFLVPMELAKARNIQLSPRAVFCDVSGHANERTILASIVPGLVVCGNKVPSCVFDSDDERLPHLWTAIANSFVIDWIMRRWVSTTINYFYWRNTPFPRISPDSPDGLRLVECSRRLMAGALSGPPISLVEPFEYAPPTEREELRAEIDGIVANLFCLSADELALILSDFPLTDRLQPGLEGCSDSVTKNLATEALVLRAPDRSASAPSGWSRQFREIGAIAYVPSEKAVTAKYVQAKPLVS